MEKKTRENSEENKKMLTNRRTKRCKNGHVIKSNVVTLWRQIHRLLYQHCQCVALTNANQTKKIWKTISSCANSFHSQHFPSSSDERLKREKRKELAAENELRNDNSLWLSPPLWQTINRTNDVFDSGKGQTNMTRKREAKRKVNFYASQNIECGREDS